MLVVTVDTSGPVVGVAVGDGRRVVMREGRMGRGADGVLLPWMVEALEELGVRGADVQGVGVTGGPGTFTGLRVGLATAGALALGWGVPLWTGVSLHSRAIRAQGALAGEERARQPVLSLLDARKERVYAAWYVDGRPVWGPADVPVEVALAEARGAFVATGEGAVVYRGAIAAAGGSVAREAESSAVDALVSLTRAGLLNGEGRSAMDLQPLYLREADAIVPADMVARRG